MTRESLKMLDCFCGKGGVSDGYSMTEFDVTGIDIVDAPKMLGYKHHFIQADMLTLRGEDFNGFDVIWGSPPCRDFSKMSFVGFGSKRPNGVLFKWKDPPNPDRGLLAVRAFLRFVEVAKPTFWVMENVPYLEKYLKIKPRQTSSLTRTMKRSFWGNYPSFLLPSTTGGKIKIDVQGKLRSWERAKVPLACSHAFARACHEALLEPSLEVSQR